MVSCWMNKTNFTKAKLKLCRIKQYLNLIKFIFHTSKIGVAKCSSICKRFFCILN